MEQNNYVFRITAMGEEYLSQISYALEKRTELLSRNRYPGIWKTTDKLRASVQGLVDYLAVRSNGKTLSINPPAYCWSSERQRMMQRLFLMRTV